MEAACLICTGSYWKGATGAGSETGHGDEEGHRSEIEDYNLSIMSFRYINVVEACEILVDSLYVLGICLFFLLAVTPKLISLSNIACVNT